MYFSSKTEPLDRQNMNPNFYFEQPTLTQGIINSDLGLSKAITIIEQLKQNLSFALKINEALAEQNQILKSNAERTTKKINSQALAWQKKLREIQQEKQEIAELLEQTRSTLLDTEEQYEQSRKEMEKFTRIIHEQKKAYEELQQNFMNQSLNYVGDTSTANISRSQQYHIAEIEKQNHELIIQIKKLNQQVQKNEARTSKLERENNQFKKWMASVLGLQKVVEGSQRILMKEIGERMLPC